MMKLKNKIAFLCTLIMLISLCTGCKLATPEKNSGKDNLIGVFVTSEHLDLFDFEAYLNDNYNGLSNIVIDDSAKNDKYNGRIYATLKKSEIIDDNGIKSETIDYAFEGLEGVPFFAVTIYDLSQGDSYRSIVQGEGINDSSNHIAYSDDSYSCTLKGKIYALAGGRLKSIFLNPVYQNAANEVYLTAGTGMTFMQEDISGESSGSGSMKMEEENVTIIDKKTVVNKLFLEIEFEFIDKTDKISVYQMDKNNTIINNEIYYPENMPKEIQTHKNADYLIVEEHSSFNSTEAITRKIYQKIDTALESIVSRSDGYMIKQQTIIKWA